MQSYRDLRAWQISMDVVVFVYKETRSFPKDERFGMVDQMRRASVSVPCNISEGSSRLTVGEFLNSLSIARGSHAELETLVIAAERLGYLSSEELIRECEESGRVLSGLIRSLRVKRTGH
jgi:four helix bundle protein